MLRAAFIIESEKSAAARYRVLSNVDRFEDEGVDAYPMLLPERRRDRRKLFEDISDFDVVVLQRRLIQPWDTRLLRRHSRVLGYDFDDALVYRDRAAKGFSSLSRRVKFRAITRAADFITAGNDYLTGLCDPNGPPTFVVPTPVDTSRYVPADRGEGPVRIGWVGSASTLGYLEDMIPTLERVHAARPATRLVVVSDAFPAPAPSFMRAVNWHEDTEAAEVASFDIGIMPLPDNPWTRGKCGFKLLLYGACAAASVASPVGVNTEIIVEGETGLLASTPQEWQESLVKLIDDRARRRLMGREARRRVEAQYSAEVVIGRWAAILKKACANATSIHR